LGLDNNNGALWRVYARLRKFSKERAIMIRQLLAFLTVAAILAAASVSSHAQTIVLLPDDYVKKLNPKALKTYEEGVKAYDHVNLDLALEKFYKAMQQDPKHIKIRFLVAQFAHERGRMKTGEKTIQFFSMAEEALNGLVARKGLKDKDLERAERDLSVLKRDQDNVANRDIIREATGKQIVAEIIKEREEFAKTGLPPLQSDLDKREEMEAEAKKRADGEGGNSQNSNR
jgi:hypothetical protein